MESAVALASGATDSTARLWSAEGKLLRTLEGHTDRLGRIAFHPMGRHLGEGGAPPACMAGVDADRAYAQMWWPSLPPLLSWLLGPPSCAPLRPSLPSHAAPRRHSQL